MNQLTVNSTQITTSTSLNADLFSSWISYLDRSPKTIQTYTRAIKQFNDYLAEEGIRNPQRADVLAYRDQLKVSLKPATVQAYITAVKLFFQWTSQEGIYPNIADRVKGAKLDKGFKKDYLTTKQASKMLTSVDLTTKKGKRDHAILALMITTGLRTIEVCRADIADLRTVADFAVLYIQGKGHEEKNEYVKLAEPVEQAIRDYLWTREATSDSQPLFSSIAHRNDGERMTTRSVSRIAKEHLVSAGLKSDRWTAHSLRHTAATLNLLNGGTVEETQQLLRHSNINTTLIYSHALERAKNNSESRVAHAIFG